MRKWLAIFFLAAAAGVGVLIFRALTRRKVSPPDSLHPPNIVLIVVDTLRRDHVGCYGHSLDSTPNIDRLARDGARFDQMISASSFTVPSVMSLFTGLPPTLHRTGFNSKLPSSLTTLAAELHTRGYQTAGVSPNPSTRPSFGFGVGFDTYLDDAAIIERDSSVLLNRGKTMTIRDVTTSEVTTRLANEWLEQKRDGTKPFFLFALYLDPHADYVPPPPYDKLFDSGYVGMVDGHMYAAPLDRTEREKTHVKALYDGEIRCADEQIGKLLAKLDQLGLADNTLVMLTADHGEEFWEHGRTLHGHSLYDELIRVPCIVRWPASIEAGLNIPDQVSGVNVMPTLLEAAGAHIPVQCQGPSLLGLLARREKLPPQVCYSETIFESKALRMVRSAGQKMIMELRAGTPRFYDLTRDPGERDDLRMEDRFKALAASYDDYMVFMQAHLDNEAPQKPELDGAAIERLRQMGYSQ
jgi:arylsulfatase A-like enzyme